MITTASLEEKLKNYAFQLLGQIEINDEEFETKTAFEISVSKLEIVENSDDDEFLYEEE